MRAEKLIQQTKEYDQYVKSSPYADILQTWEWGEIKKGDTWAPHRFVVIDGKKIVASAQVLLRQLQYGYTILYSPRGPVVDWQNPKATTIFELLCNRIRQEFKTNKLLFCKIGPPIDQGDQAAPIAHGIFDKQKLVSGGRTIQPQHTSVVDLSPSEDEIWANFESSARYGIKRAKREGVTVELTNGENDKRWEQFFVLYTQTVNRAQFSARSNEHFKRVKQYLSNKDMVKVAVASYKDNLLAAAVILKLGQSGYYLWGGSNRDQPQKHGAYALQWAIMQTLKKEGVTNYDLWGIAPTNDPKEPWAGHTKFKKAFGGKKVSYIGDYDLPFSPFYKPYRLLNWARETVFYLPKKIKG